VDSEQLLAQALRAQAAGAPGYRPEPATTALPAARPARRVAAGWLLLAALVLGLLAGITAGVVTVL
jgi:hypothetical protein